MPLPTRSCPGPVSRRRFLQLGSLAVGAGLHGLLPWRLEAQVTGSPSDTAVILIWLPGGPPHMETYDMKPDAPAEYRGDFRPIHTNVPGIDVCELLPQHARIADKFAIIRSIAHEFADHGGGHKRFLTGRAPRSPVGFVNDHPMVGSMVARMRQGRQARVPNYIAGTDPGRDGIDVFSFGSAYLGPATHPFMVTGDPSDPRFEVRNVFLSAVGRSRLLDRQPLLGAFDGPPAAPDTGGTMTAMDHYRRQAFRLMTADGVRQAFDLGREPARLRERYGMHVWGQRALLARRLVEQGASFVTMVMENPYQSGVPFPRDGTYNWDSHAVNCHLFNDARLRLPLYDRAIAALIEDLYARGLDRKVLLIVTGEFGRTPRITYAQGTQTGVQQPGRDHWPQAMSVLVSGGGLRTGQVVGSTNSRGEHPKDRPMTPNDLWATMFRHLGIDYQFTTFPDNTGRPMPILPDGAPIRELV
jgi:hypothetical protein